MALLPPRRRSAGPAPRRLSEARIWLALLLGVLALRSGSAAAQEPGTESGPVFERVFGHSQTVEELDLELPVIVDGRLRRAVPARVAGDLVRVRLRSSVLLVLLGETLRPDLLDRIARAADADGYVSLAALMEVGLVADFDRSNLSVAVTVPPELSRLRVIRLRGGQPSVFAAVEVEPQAYSAFLNARGAFDWIGTTSSALKRGLQPMRLELDGAANLHDWVLEGAVSAEEDARFPWKRREVRLVRDLPERQIRVQLGDLAYETAGFQRRQALGGLTVATNFDLQPYRVVEPAGSQEFTLDLPSQVEVIVNGRLVRSLQLLPGRYDLRDFRLGTGINDVLIRMRDSLGRERELHFGLSFEPRLLAVGTREFSLAAGVPTFERDVIRYDRDNFGYSLFHRYGLSEGLTLGANLQGDRQRRLFGLEAVFASEWGSLRADVALSDDDDAGASHAGRLQYEYYDGTTQNQNRRRWIVSALSRSRRFTGVGGAVPDNPTAYEFSASVSQEFWSTGVRGSVATVYALGRGDTSDSSTMSLSLRRRLFRDWEVELSLDRTLASGERPEQSAFVTVTWTNRERNHTVRLNHDTTDHSTQLEWQRTPSRSIGGTATSVGVSRRPEQYELAGSFQHVGSRLEAELFQRSTSARTARGLDEHRTSVRVSSALAFAGGEFAISRPISQSFALVARHKSLAGKTIGVDRSGGGGVQIDRLGPAVLPNLVPYQIRAVAIDAPDLPPGFDLGEEFFATRPTYKSGLLIRVGKDAMAVVRGRLIMDGEPVRLQAGVVRALGEPREELVLFTNRKGKFSRGGLRPGRYELSLHFAPGRSIEFEIPEGTAGLYDVGELPFPGS